MDVNNQFSIRSYKLNLNLWIVKSSFPGVDIDLRIFSIINSESEVYLPLP